MSTNGMYLDLSPAGGDDLVRMYVQREKRELLGRGTEMK